MTIGSDIINESDLIEQLQNIAEQSRDLGPLIDNKLESMYKYYETQMKESNVRELKQKNKELQDEIASLRGKQLSGKFTEKYDENKLLAQLISYFVVHSLNTVIMNLGMRDKDTDNAIEIFLAQDINTQIQKHPQCTRFVLDGISLSCSETERKYHGKMYTKESFHGLMIDLADEKFRKDILSRWK